MWAVRLEGVVIWSRPDLNPVSSLQGLATRRATLGSERALKGGKEK